MAETSAALASPQPTPDQPPSYPNPRKTRKEQQGRFQELPLQPLASLCVPWIVQGVLAEHDLGQFQRSALLWEQIRRDDRVAATMSVRINALLGLEHDFQQSKTKKKIRLVTDDEESAATMERAWEAFAEPPDRVQILSWALGVGFAFGRVEWQMTADEWMPQLTVWHPSFVSWRPSELMYYAQTANAGQQPITPGENGWWLWAPFGHKRGWTFGYVHQLAMPWMARSFSYRDWCRYNEVHGLPTTKAYIPPGTQDDDEARYLTELANRTSAPTVRLPLNKDNTKGYDFELVEAKADTWEAFQGMKNDANVDIAVAVLGQNLTTEVKGGSFAAAKVQDKVRGDVLEADARAFEAFLNAQVMGPYAQYNLPGGAANAPKLRFQTKESVDMLTAGQGLGAIGDGLIKAKAAGIQVDVDEVTRRTDIPTTGPWEEPEPPPPANVPPAQLTPGIVTPPAKFPKQVTASEGETEEERATRLGHPSARATQEQGQAYADAIVELFSRSGATALNEDRLKVLSVIMQAETFEEMQGMLERVYSEMDPAALAELMATAEKLAELNGWFSARGA